jgi:hypothetical protein
VQVQRAASSKGFGHHEEHSIAAIKLQAETQRSVDASSPFPFQAMSGMMRGAAEDIADAIIAMPYLAQ